MWFGDLRSSKWNWKIRRTDSRTTGPQSVIYPGWCPKIRREERIGGDNPYHESVELREWFVGWRNDEVAGTV